MSSCGCDFTAANGLFISSGFDPATSNNLYTFTIDSSNINYNYSSNKFFFTDSNISNIYFNNSITDSNVSNLIYYNDSNISNIYYNTGFIDSNFLWWRYELLNTQLELANTKITVAGLNTSLNITTTTVSAQGFTLGVHTGQIDVLEDKVENLENNTFTKLETSNIFTTSNVLSNTSNFLVNYDNLINKPDVYTKTEIDINNYTKIQTDNTFTTLTQSNLLYLTLKNDITNTNDNNKWIVNGNNLYTLDYNIGIGKNIPNYKVDINGSLSSTDYRFNDKQLFSLLPSDSPIFNSAISTQISPTEYYVSYTQNDTMILNKTYTVDILIVGAGGRGGSSSFAGGGGAGEVIYIPNYILPQGVYNITIGIDSATPANRISKLYYQPTFTDLITANGGGDGGSVIRSYSIQRRYPPKLYNSITARTSTTFNGQASFKTTMTLDTSGITYGSGVYDVYFSTIFNTSGYDGNLCFNYVENATSGQWATITTQYSTTSPFSYSGTRYLVESTYKGEFICIKLPVAIALTSYSIVAVNSTEGAGRAPKSFKLYASNNGTSWTTLQTITGATYTTRVYNNTGLSANTTLYSYYGIVINQIIGSGTTSGITQIAEWILNGKEYFVNYINDTSGGSGGGGSGGADAYITNQTGSVAGSPFNITYSKLTAGADGINANGGNGGSALVSGRYTDLISGIQVGAGGTGATASSTPITKINYGDGGDGNGGLGRQGIIIMKFTSGDVITKFLEYTDYNKLFNKPNLLTKEETSNIFTTSNVLSNTSNFLVNYNNLINKPDVYTKTEIDTNIFTKTEINNNFYNKTQIDNNIYTKTQSDTNYYTKANVYTKTESDNNYYNKSLVYTKTESDNNYYNKTESDNNYYNKTLVYTKTESDTNYYTKANVYTKTESDNNYYNKTYINTNYYTKTQSDTNYYTKANVYTKTESDNNYYTKTQINTNINTGKINVNTTGLTLYNSSVFNVSNSITIRTTAVPDMTTAAGYNDFNVAIGVGKPEGFTVIPVNGLGQVSQYNLPYLVGVSDKFAGMKILTNDITIINSPQNVLINANGTLEMYGTRISMLGEIFTNGSLVVKAPKFFTTTRTDTFNGVSCLAYDIDLSLYTNKPTINGFAHRRFRINFTHSNGRLDFQFAPKTFYVSLSTYNTLSCHSTDDLYGVSQLDIVGLQYCLFRNTIDKITFIAPTSLYGTTNITMYFVIEDLFSG